MVLSFMRSFMNPVVIVNASPLDINIQYTLHEILKGRTGNHLVAPPPSWENNSQVGTHTPHS